MIRRDQRPPRATHRTRNHSDDDWYRDHREHRARDRDHEQPVAARRGPLLPGVPLEQLHVPVVGLPRHVERIAEERHCADHRVDDHVQQHPQLHDARDAELHAGDDDGDRVERRDHVAETGQQPEDRIPAEPDAETGNLEDAVELCAPASQHLQPGLHGGTERAKTAGRGRHARTRGDGRGRRFAKPA